MRDPTLRGAAHRWVSQRARPNLRTQTLDHLAPLRDLAGAEIEECAHARRLAEKHPRYESLVSQATSVYGDIMRKGLNNEHSATVRKATPN